MSRASDKPIAVVLGMHRSGTSAIAGVLQHLGVHFGAEQFEPNSWNELGYFEDRRIVELNERIFQTLGRTWHSLAPIAWADFEKIQHFQDEAVELMRRMSAGQARTGIKDPRICLLLPFWKTVFGAAGLTPRYLFTVRNPKEVSASLRDRDSISFDGGCWLWLTHVISALQALGGEVCTLVKYDKLLERPLDIVRALASLFDLPTDETVLARVAGEFVRPDLNRHGGEQVGDDALPHPAMQTLFELLSVQETLLNPSPLAMSEEWRSVERAFVGATPFLEFHDHLMAADGQVSLLSGRLATTEKALANVEALAVSRLQELAETRASVDAVQRLALDRMVKLQALEERLARTDEAKADAERLALDRLVREQHLQEELERTQEAKANAEEIVRDRDRSLMGLTQQIDEVRAAHEEVQRLALDRLIREQHLQEELERTQQAKANAEKIVRERDLSLAGLTQQIDEVRAAHEEVQRLALDRLVREQHLQEELERTQDAKAHAEEIVKERDRSLTAVTAQVNEVRAAHEEVQRLALDRLLREQYLQEELERTQEAKANAEEIIRGRDRSLADLAQQINEVRAAYEEAHRLALDRLARERNLHEELQRTQAAKAQAESLVVARMEENTRLNREFEALKSTLKTAYDTIALRESVITAIYRWPLWRVSKKLGLIPRVKGSNE